VSPPVDGVWVLERQGQTGDRLKAPALPEANSSIVGAHNEVELHGSEAAVAGVLRRIAK